jgi:flagellar biosynthesis protein FlhF
MKVKTYVAPSAREALARIREELGPDALILHERPARRGGLFGLLGQRSGVEVAVAVGDGPPPTALQRRQPRRTPLDLRSEIRGGQAGRAAEGMAAGALRPRADELDELRRILADMRAAMEQLSMQAGREPAATRHPALGSIFRRLRDEGVEELVAARLVDEVAGELDQQALASPDAVRAATLRALARRLTAAEPTLQPGEETVLVLIGPTGAGKTTTLAKLAATFTLAQHLRVRLITTDTDRAGAVDQLQFYAQLLGLPMQVAASPEELRAALETPSADVVLVDTPGRSQQDTAHLEGLRTLLEAIPPARRRVYLTVSATTDDAALVDIARRFALVPLNGLVLTKLDEASRFGPSFNLACRSALPLVFFTTGQEVPDDLEPARPQRLAALVLGTRVKVDAL